MSCKVCGGELVAATSSAWGNQVEVKGNGETPTFFSGGLIYCPKCGIKYLFDPDGDDLKLIYTGCSDYIYR